MDNRSCDLYMSKRRNDLIGSTLAGMLAGVDFSQLGACRPCRTTLKLSNGHLVRTEPWAHPRMARILQEQKWVSQNKRRSRAERETIQVVFSAHGLSLMKASQPPSKPPGVTVPLPWELLLP